MNVATETNNAKIMQRVQKLLNLARDGGATEAEANLAMERAQQIMAEHGLSIAVIEASGGEGEARQKNGVKGRAHRRYMIMLMETLAEISFVHVARSEGYKSFDGERRRSSWTLIGRESAVASVNLMHEYLVNTVRRVSRERGTPGDEVFKEAMAERVCQRLRERHEKAMAEQKREAKEREAAARHPGAATGNALVVVMEDYARKERELNRDMARGVPPGTTAREREESEQRAAKRELEIQQRQREISEREAELIAAGVDADKAYYLARGYSEEEAERYCKPKSEEQVRRENERMNRNWRKWEEQARRRAEREARRRNSPSYREGVAAGDKVGLDQQVGRAEQGKLK